MKTLLSTVFELFLPDPKFKTAVTLEELFIPDPNLFMPDPNLFVYCFTIPRILFIPDPLYALKSFV